MLRERAEWRESRFQIYAYLARYANQQLVHMLGREPSMREFLMFHKAVRKLVEQEPVVRMG